MILGKIKVRMEYPGGKKYLYCRPVLTYRIIQNDVYISNNLNRFCTLDNQIVAEIHPSIIGICHVVKVEKCMLLPDFVKNREVEVFAIFDRAHSIEEFRAGFTKLKITPIAEDIYYSLKEIYPQSDHAFVF